MCGMYLRSADGVCQKLQLGAAFLRCLIRRREIDIGRAGALQEVVVFLGAAQVGAGSVKQALLQRDGVGQLKEYEWTRKESKASPAG